VPKTPSLNAPDVPSNASRCSPHLGMRERSLGASSSGISAGRAERLIDVMLCSTLSKHFYWNSLVNTAGLFRKFDAG
jgi:hypothetical protein